MPYLVDRKMYKEQIVEKISKAVKSIQSRHSLDPAASEEVVLTHEDQEFCRLVDSLDHALLHGIRNHSNGYWVLVIKFTHKEDVERVQSLTRVTTHLGRGRAWLHLALTESCLECYLRMFTENPKLLKKYYSKEALVLDDSSMNVLMTLAAGIEYIKFQPELDLPYLDLYCNPVLSRRSITEDDDSSSIPRRSITRSSIGGSSITRSSIAGSSSMYDGEIASICSIDSSTVSQGSDNVLEQGVDVANLSDESEISTPLPRSDSFPQSPLVAESPSQRLARISQLPAPAPADLDDLDGAPNDLEVIRVKVKTKKMKKRRSRRESESDTVSVGEMESVASAESGYRSVRGQSPRDGETNRLSVTSDSLPVDREDEQDSLEKERLEDKDRVVEQAEEKLNRLELVPESTNQEESNKASTNDRPCTMPSESKMEDSQNLQQNVVFSVSMDSNLKWNSDIQTNKEKAEEPKEILSIYDGLLKTDEEKLKDSSKDASEKVQTPSKDSEISESFVTELLQEEKLEREKSSADSPSMSTSSKGSSSCSLSTELAAGPSSSVSQDTESAVRKMKDEVEDFEVRVDNNLKLVLMLEVLQSDHEQILKVYHTSIGHTEGDAVAVSVAVLLTDAALYVLVPGLKTRFSRDTVIPHRHIDYVALSLNQQVINVVCKNRRNQLWITTGNRQLTRAMIRELSAAYASCDGGQYGELSVLDDATTQTIALRKWVAAECNAQGSSITIAHYALVHWEDRQPGAGEIAGSGTHEGTLMMKTSSSYFGLAGGAWVPGYFVLKDGQLMQYSSQHDANPPQLCISLNCEHVSGVRRARSTEREHAFEVITPAGDALTLCADTDANAMAWLHALCQALSQGMGVLLPNSGLTACVCVVACGRVLLCHEDVQTGFVRTLSSAPLTDVTHALTDPGAHTYIILVFDSPEGMESNKWLLFFNGASERDSFYEALSNTWSKHFEVPLPIQSIEDIELQKRCRDSLRKLKRKRVM